MAVTERSTLRVPGHRRAFRAWRLRRPSGGLGGLPWVSIFLLSTFLFVAAFPQLVTVHDQNAMNLADRLQPPGTTLGDRWYPLGTDALGRDLYSRLVFGARVSLAVAATGLLLGGGLGLAIGVVSGYLGGRIDALLMRLTDCFMALPALLISLVFVMTVGAGLSTIILALAVIQWARFSRVIRSEVLLLKERDFVSLAKVAGCSSLRIMLVHILPNVLNTFMVLASLQVSVCILTEATLSFLGAGVPPPTPTWGNMVSDGRTYITSAWWISLFPGLALTLVVFACNTFGDWLRDRLDPKLRQL